MREIVGTYASAKVFSDDVEPYVLAQVQMICDNEAAFESSIRVMPDVHPGKVGPIGLTMTVGEKVLPSLVGYDIGCGVLVAEINARRMEFQKLDSIIAKNIPSGFAIRKSPHQRATEQLLGELMCADSVRTKKAMLGLGTLGGGNHFIEVDRAEDGKLYLAIHSGSRHLGKEVAEHYMRLGQEALKAKGAKVAYELTYLEGELKRRYLNDQEIVCRYAQENRRAILGEIAKGMKWKVGGTIDCAHNYIDADTARPMLRKGAISAKEGEPVVIPINMRDGIILGKGLGNEEWNLSAPHGAGRIYRRDEVRNHYTVNQFKHVMEGIHSTCINSDTLDEAPFAYRGLEAIEGAIGDTVSIECVIRPIYCFKAGGK